MTITPICGWSLTTTFLITLPYVHIFFLLTLPLYLNMYFLHPTNYPYVHAISLCLYVSEYRKRDLMAQKLN